jgi:hypothetical protein
VRELTKDPHCLHFIRLAKDVSERDFEDALLANLDRFLRELGHSYSYVGRQYRLDIDGTEFFMPPGCSVAPTSAARTPIGDITNSSPTCVNVPCMKSPQEPDPYRTGSLLCDDDVRRPVLCHVALSDEDLRPRF